MMTDDERESRKIELAQQVEILREQKGQLRDRSDAEVDEFYRKLESLESELAHVRRTHPHGTRASYARGCRCDDCRVAMSTYLRERAEARQQGDYRGAIPADRARIHLEQCKAAGVSMNLLSRLIKVDSFYLHSVLTGYKKNIRANFEAAILSCSPEHAAGQRMVRTKPARLHIEALEQRGVSLSQIAQTCGIEEWKIKRIKTHRYVESRIERAVLALSA